MINGARYIPGMARVGEPTPQSDPDLFADAEIRAEIRYLLKLNKRYGTHHLRVGAYLALDAYLRARGDRETKKESTS